MSVKKVPKHPKQLIIDHYDSLVNKLDVYVEQLIEKYGDDELLEESESRAVTKDDCKKSDFKIVDDDDEEEESEDEEDIEENNISSGEESEEDDSDEEDPIRLLERRYMYIDSEDENDASKCEDSEKDKNEENEDEDEQNNKDDQKEEEDIEIDHESEEDDDRWMDDDLNNYSFYEYDEWDENVEDIEDEEVYEEAIYGIKEFSDPYGFDYRPNKQAQFELREERSSIKTRDYLNQVRSFMIDEIRKVETQQLESYEANKAGFNFDKNSSIGEMKKEIFKDRFCFLIDTKTNQNHDFSNSREKKNRVFNLCFIITDFYLNRSQLNRIKYIVFYII